MGKEKDKKPLFGGIFQKFFKPSAKAEAKKKKEHHLTVQRSIPYLEMGRDGICRVEEHLYSKTVRLPIHIWLFVLLTSTSWISVLSANMSKKKSVLFGKKAVGQLLEQLQPDIVQGVGMPPYRMTLGYKRAIHFVTLRNYCYEDYPDYYGKIPGTVMAFLDLNLIKKRMAVGEPFVTCSESLTKMYRSRQNMEIP